ncbi:hypothetical protein [Duganella vulcania]|uniref:Uncharacterized protein n=1 Tax=Duganella vulcania TaxID=2692166 RepID=A0A845GES7_9BURK|nr:hypothetical protein [Duganella vulcania]MYM92804.1 hypothetical protein [Duganella vulcania]
MSNTMNFEQFKERFEPIKNHLNPLADLEGLMFHLGEKELAYVRQQESGTIWTVHLIDGVRVIASVFSSVDREGYLVARNAIAAGSYYEVIDDDDMEERDE